MKLRIKDVVARFGLESGAVWLAADVAAPVEPWQQHVNADIPIYVRAELGVRPDVEVIHLGYKIPSTVYTWWTRRAQEGTSAQSWGVGTALTFVREDAEPRGVLTLHLRHPFAATSVELDLQGAFRRVRLEDELLWERSLMFDRGPSNPPGPLRHLDVWRIPRLERGKEGTVATSHAAGSELTFLRPGEA